MDANDALDMLHLEPTKQKLIYLRGSDNYTQWSNSIRLKLAIHDLSDLVDSAPTKTAREAASGVDGSSKWRQRNLRANNAIYSSISEPLLNQFQNLIFGDTYYLWEEIQAQYGNNNRLTIGDFMSKLTDLHVKSKECDGNIETYCRTFVHTAISLNSMLQGTGQNSLPDMILNVLFVKGVESIPALETWVIAQRTADMPIQSLASSLRQHAMTLPKLESNNLALIATTNKCRIHPKSKHTNERCFVQHPELRPGSVQPRPSSRSSGEKEDAERALIAVPVEHAALLATPADDVVWIFDTGASSHFVNDVSLLQNMRRCDMDLAAWGPITAVGDTVLHTPEGGVHLKDVYYARNLPYNLISAGIALKRGFTIHANLSVLSPRGSVLFKLHHHPNNLLQVVTQAQPPQALPAIAAEARPDALLWHQRLGHLGQHLSNRAQAESIGINCDITLSSPCEICHLSKATRASFHERPSRSIRPLFRIYYDVVGPIKPLSPADQRFLVLLTDDYSGYRWTYEMVAKSETFEHLLSFIKRMERHRPNDPVAQLQSDGGSGEAIHALNQFLGRNGIDIRRTAAFTPEQNGISEATNKVIVTRARSMILDSGLPANYWLEAVKYAVAVSNLIPTGERRYPPKRMFENGTEPVDLSHLKRFGCYAYVWIPNATKSKKFEPQAEKGIFLGFQNHSIKTYRILLPSRRGTLSAGSEWRVFNPDVVETPHATFDELHVFADLPQVQQKSLTRKQIKPIQIDKQTELNASETEEFGLLEPLQICSERPGSDDEESHELDLDHTALSNDPDEDPQTPTVDEHDACVPENDLNDEVENDLDTTNVRRSLRSHSQIDYNKLHNGRLALLVTDGSAAGPYDTDPTTYQDAMERSDRELWQRATKVEVDQITNLKVWEIMDESQLPEGQILIKGRWVLRIKRLPSGAIDKYKARWVAKGFMQRPGFEYHDTASSTLSAATARLLVAIAAARNWTIHQMDVVSAFLNGKLDVPLYVEAPHGYYKGKICRVVKALYGFKQAPLMWQKTLFEMLKKNGFNNVYSDVCCFSNAAKNVYLLVWVDDLLITGPNEAGIAHIKAALHQTFQMKEVTFNTYLGLCVSRDKAGITITQEHYINQMLHEFGAGLETSSTPMTANELTAEDGNLLKVKEAKQFQSIVGQLQWLACQTRPDISFSVNRVARYTQHPRDGHLAAAIRILRYLKGTKSLGLHYDKQPQLQIAGYADADWASDPDLRRSVSGSVYYCAGGPVLWRSKRQTTIATSTTEAEYAALAESMREGKWLWNILHELKIAHNTIPIYEDNCSTINLAMNHTNHKRCKHVDLNNHFCRECVCLNLFAVIKVGTNDQAADGLTKALGADKFARFVSMLHLRAPPTRTFETSV